MGQVNQAEVLFDAQRRQNYNLDAKGNRVYHGVPVGFQFSATGELELGPDATVAQVEGWGVQAACGLQQQAEYVAALVRAFERQAGPPQQSVFVGSTPQSVSSQQSVAAVIPPPPSEPVHVVRVGDGGGGAEQG